MILFTGMKTQVQPTSVAKYLSQMASNTKITAKSLQDTLSAKAASLQIKAGSVASNRTDTLMKNARTTSNDNKKPITSMNAELYEKAERNMCSLHKVIDDPAKLIKHELRAWKQRKKDIKGIFVLDKHKLRKLARKAGMTEVSSFVYNYKQSSGTFAFPRPNFETAWKFRVLNSHSYASIGHLLRILHCCLRWDVINIRPPKGVNHCTTTSKGEWSFLWLFPLANSYKVLMKLTWSSLVSFRCHQTYLGSHGYEFCYTLLTCLCLAYLSCIVPVWFCSVWLVLILSWLISFDLLGLVFITLHARLTWSCFVRSGLVWSDLARVWFCLLYSALVMSGLV